MVELDPRAMSEKNSISCLVSLSAGILLENAAPSRPIETILRCKHLYHYLYLQYIGFYNKILNYIVCVCVVCVCVPTLKASSAINMK